MKDDLKPRDHLLVYYAGHGEGGAGNAGGNWLPVDALPPAGEDRTERSQGAAKWISRADVVKWTDGLPALHVLVVDDSCHSGAVREADMPPEDVPDGRVLGAPTSTEVLHRRGPSPNASGDTNTAPQAAQGGIAPDARMGNSESSIASTQVGILHHRRARVWLSAGGDEPIPAKAAGGDYSYFSGPFLSVLRDNQGAMDGLGLFRNVRRHMASTKAPQVPAYYPLAGARDRGGDFVFIKKTWRVDVVELNLGRVAVHVSETGNVDDQALIKLTLEQLQQTDAGSRKLRPGERAADLLLLISFPDKTSIELTMFDQETGQMMGSSTQVLSQDAEVLAANIRAALLSLRPTAERELLGKEVSVDIVKRAIAAQRIHAWDINVALGPAMFIDLDGEGELSSPAVDARVGIDYYVASYLLVGAVVGFSTTKARNTSQAFFGDIATGSMSYNDLTGELALHTLTTMLRATLRQPHGLLLPFVSVAGGIAHHDLVLGDEVFTPKEQSDTLPVEIVVGREDTSAFAPSATLAVGSLFVLNEWLALRVQLELFRTFHDLKVERHFRGVDQARTLVSDFQAVQGVSATAGASVLL